MPFVPIVPALILVLMPFISFSQYTLVKGRIEVTLQVSVAFSPKLIDVELKDVLKLGFSANIKMY